MFALAISHLAVYMLPPVRSSIFAIRSHTRPVRPFAFTIPLGRYLRYALVIMFHPDTFALAVQRWSSYCWIYPISLARLAGPVLAPNMHTLTRRHLISVR